MEKKPEPFRVGWEAHEYEYKERSSDWFWVVGIVAFALAVTAAIFGNLILGILIIVATSSLSLFINREPGLVDVTITEKGVTRSKVHYPFQGLHSFWIESEHRHPVVRIRSQKFYLPLIVIHLGDADAEHVHEVLSRHLIEEHHTPPLVERLLEHLGF